MNRLDRDGVQISWSAVGSGPALLMTHGYMAASHMWNPNLDALSAEHTVITWDIRGHGASDYPDDPAEYSKRIATDDMASLLDAVGVQRATIVGMSMGGFLSLVFHLHHPGRTAGLILVDCGPGFKGDEGRVSWNERCRGYVTQFAAGDLRELDRTRSEIKDAAHRSTLGLSRVAAGILTQEDDSVITMLPDISVPALVVVGEYDERFIPGSAYMAKKIPGAEYYVVPEAGHAANMDNAPAFNERVTRFLTQHGL